MTGNWIILFFLVVGMSPLKAGNDSIKISLLHEHSLHSFALSVEEGEYIVYRGDSLVSVLGADELLYVSGVNGYIQYRSRKLPLGQADSLDILAVNENAVIRVKGMHPVTEVRSYCGDILVRNELGRMRLINELPVNRYLAGVVQAEGGPYAPYEFFKTQAVIARTYALTHKDNHAGSCYDLCDGVHCQVYHGKIMNPDILQAVHETRRLVIAGADNAMINATFHSNCGGETADAADVWIGGKPYLKSIRDPWCSSGRNFRWEKTISANDWISYLRKKGAELPGDGVPELIQEHRQAVYTVGGTTLSLRQIREDWGLRSAFFSLVQEGDSLLLRGRGYGHGVGLCQEGAMEMARQGMTFKQIIRFYYQQVSIKQVEELFTDR